MEIIMSIGAKISEYTVEPIGRQVGYLFYYKSNAENLITEIQKLKYVKDRLQHSIDEAKNNGEEIEADVLHWLSRVDRMITQHTDSFVRNEGQANMRCLSGQFPDLGSQYRMSRKAKKMAVEVGIAIQAAGGFNTVSYLPVLQSIFEVKGYVAFQSRMSTFKRIMEALRNPNFNTIGVYGMGGVGKTMLCKEVAKQAKGQLLFSKVVVVTISQTPNLENIQQEVAEKLGLNLNEKSIPVRADRLRHRLRQEKKILVILDDIWEKLELQDIGISFGDDKNECKILLTSRSRDVLCNDMGVEQNFLVGVLSVSEANNLFNTIVADAIKNPSIQPVAIEIVKECAGLPIAIATVANALKNKSLPVWNNALQELRISTPTNIKGMHEKVYSSLKLSYDSLRSTEAKSLLLLCSLFHEDANIDIEHLLRQGTGWGLFKGITKLEDARNKVVTLVEDLKICCLLLDGDYGCCVKMHDVIRDVTISIASRDRHLHNFGSIAELEECITDIDFRESTAISLSVTDQNCHLPESDGVPYHRDLTIPNHFFEEMKELRVLELINICLRPLPSSFRFFENLQTLCLWYCDIGEVAIIGELKNLKILDLSGSNIKELPKEIGHLTHLRLLDLKYCSKLKVIRPNIISCLTSLQELNMDGTFIDWEVNDDSGERSNASLVELKNLHQLTALHLQIPDASILPKEFFSEKLERYDLIIGNAHARFVVFGFEISKRLYLKLNKRDIFNQLGLEILLKKSEMLFLNGLEGLNSVVRELDGEGFPQLKHLHFENNGGTQYIVNSMEEAHACSAFVSLDILHLKRLMNLEKMYHGKLTEKCFRKLRVIKVDSCDKLKNLFSFSMARGLLQLEEIAVTSCKMMEKIIFYEAEDDSRNMSYETIQKIQFPQLRTLTLCSLPNLTHFFSQVETNCQRQRKDEQQIADFSMSFFNEKVTFPKLKTLKLERSASLKEIWHDQSKGLHG